MLNKSLRKSKEKVYPRFKKRISDLKIHEGIDYQDQAKWFKVSAPAFHDWKSGKRAPQLSVIHALDRLDEKEKEGMNLREFILFGENIKKNY